MVLGGGLDRDTVTAACAAVRDARRRVATGQFALAVACMEYADARRAQVGVDSPPSPRATGGEFATDELAIMLRQQPWPVRCLVTRSRRIRAGLPAVWSAFARGEVDAEQVVMIDRIARRATRDATVVAIDELAVGAAQTRSPRQLGSWLLRLVVHLEPDAFATRHRRALAERRVTVAQGPDGIGYVTGEMTAADAAAVDALLAVTARDLGADDPRRHEQRRADIFTDLLPGRLRFADEQPNEPAAARPEPSYAEQSTDADEQPLGPVSEGEAWIGVEDIDPDTGELLATSRVRLDADGHPRPEPSSPAANEPPIRFLREPRAVRIRGRGPGLQPVGRDPGTGRARRPQRPGARRFPPRHDRRPVRADLFGCGDRVLFTRLLTDDGGRLLDTTELGRYPSRCLAEAVRIRAGTCRHPTCTVPADRCDLDHREPHPRGPTSGANLDPGRRRHHRGKTFAWLASVCDGDTLTWTLPGRHDLPDRRRSVAERLLSRPSGSVRIRGHG